MEKYGIIANGVTPVEGSVKKATEEQLEFEYMSEYDKDLQKRLADQAKDSTAKN